MMQGVDTPTELAETLKIKPPTVMEQLGRLRRIRVVRPGEKTGREQHYVIDWHKLAEETILHTVSPRYRAGVYGRNDSAKFVKTFPEFQVFLKIYLETVLSLAEGYGKHSERYAGDKQPEESYEEFYKRKARDYVGKTRPTVWKTVDDLHATVISMMRGGNELADDFEYGEDLRPFSDCLEQWVVESTPSSPFSYTFLLQALYRLGFRDKDIVGQQSLHPKGTSE